MKTVSKYLFSVCFIIFAVTVGSFTAFAQKENTPVTPALSILASDVSLIKSEISGREICFSEEDFINVLGTNKFDSIVILSLPSEVSGKLMLGSLEVMKNQTVSKSNLSALKFVPQDSDTEECSFTFRGGYEQIHNIVCTLNYTDKENSAPIALKNTNAEDSVSTYKNISVFGKMNAVDPDNDSLRYEIVSYPKKGILSEVNKSTGEYVYTPMKNYSGYDSFEYSATDTYGNRSEIIKTEIKVTKSENGTVYVDLIGEKCHVAAIALSDMGIMSGENKDEAAVFSANEGITRSEFLFAAMKIADVQCAVSSTSSVYIDESSISPDHKAYILSAYENGIISAYSLDGSKKFNPQDYITVADACLIVNNIMKFKNSEETPLSVDLRTVSQKVTSAIEDLAEVGIIDFEGKDSSSPLTRADAAEMLFALYN